MWRKARLLLNFRWPGGSFLNRRIKRECEPIRCALVRLAASFLHSIRYRVEDMPYVSNAWNRAVFVAIQHGVLRHSSESNPPSRPARLIVCDRLLESRHVMILRTLLSQADAALDARELCFAALSTALLDIPGHDLMGFSKLFQPSDGTQLDVRFALKKSLARSLASLHDPFASAVQLVLTRTLQAIRSLVKFTTSDGTISKRSSLSRRYSLDGNP